MRNTMVLIVSMLVMLASCSQQAWKGSTATTTGPLSVGNEGSIYFMFMNMYMQDGKEHLRLDSITSVKGKIKDRIASDHHSASQLIFIFWDKQKTPIDTIHLEHPLNRVVEASDERGILHTKSVHLNQSEVTLRIQGNKAYTYLTAQSLHQHHEPTLLFHHKLQ